VTRLSIAVALGLAAGAVLLDAQQTPKFRSGTNTVSIFATVVDETGRLVTDLSRDDFEVYDNGKRQELSVFDNAVQPITIVIMLDRSGSMIRHFTLVRDAAEVFVGKLGPDDRARLGSFSSRIQLDPTTFTSDQAELIRILHEDLQEAGPTPLWKATAVAMNALAHEPGRRVVLVFTDGKDSPLNPEMATSFSEVRARAEAEDVMIYGIGLADYCTPAPAAPDDEHAAARFQRGGPPPGGRGGTGRSGPRSPRGGRIVPGRPGGLFPGRPGGTGPGGIGGIGGGGRVPIPQPPPGERIGGRPERGGSSSVCTGARPDPDLKELTADGGGGYFELRRTDDLSATFARVADELHHQYLLAFPAPALDGKVHRIEVRLRQPQLTARARKSYIASVEK
jgi:VWFA-related protein